MEVENDVVEPRCRLSDPSNPHRLCRRDNPRPSLCFRCGPVNENDDDYNHDDWHYYCETCKLVFHDACHFCPQGMRHAYHPNHPLYMTFRLSETKIQYFKNGALEMAIYFDSEPPPSTFDFNMVFETNNSCHWCEKELGVMFVRCLDCNFSLDSDCVREDPDFTITNTKIHQHALTLFPRPLDEPCCVCGLVGNKEVGYVCEPCNYLVHKKCIEPRQVIDQDHRDIDKDVFDGKEIEEVKQVRRSTIIILLKKLFVCGSSS